MSLLAAVILAVALGPSLLLLACALLVYAHDAHIHRHARSLTEREVADQLAPYGADITVWPSRAPLNGHTHNPNDSHT